MLLYKDRNCACAPDRPTTFIRSDDLTVNLLGIKNRNVYMLKVEGAFRFLPHPVQVKNALEVGSDELVIKALLVNMEEKTISEGKEKPLPEN
ncbi:hypothetical protein Peur_041823 [Populus x canadensis]